MISINTPSPVCLPQHHRTQPESSRENPARFTRIGDYGTSFDFELGVANQKLLTLSPAVGGKAQGTETFSGKRYGILRRDSARAPK
jgi:hypothetical protein